MGRRETVSRRAQLTRCQKPRDALQGRRASGLQGAAPQALDLGSVRLALEVLI